MNKIAFILLAALLTAGCREDYNSEKAFFHANKTLKAIDVAAIQANPQEALKPAVAAFEQIAEKYPFTIKAAESLHRIAGLKAAQKDFEGSRAALNKIVQNFSQTGEWGANARFTIGQMFELEKNWMQAEKTYWETAEYHPLQQKGLYAPLYVVLHYKQEKDPVKQKDAFDKALEHYDDLLRSVGPIAASASIKNFRALTYLANDDWKKAREEWISIVDQFSANPYAPLALLTTAELSWKNDDRAQSLKDYERFLAQYPKNSLAGRTAIRLALFYETDKQFAKSRQWLQKAIDEYYKSSPSGVSDIKLLIGKSYQVEGKQDKAEEVYKELEANYPNSAATLQIPFMRFMYLKKAGRMDEARQVLDEAIAHYKKLVDENPKSAVATYARQFMLSAYTQKEDWTQLMARVDEEVTNATNSESKGRWLFLKGLIAENRLKDKEKATAIYKDFLAQFPNHPLSQLAKNHQEITSQTA